MTAEQLRKSILQMAVQGKLVPQDPNDEPAHILLERIRAEKERLIKEKKIKKEKNPSTIYRGTDNLHYEKFADGTVRCIKDEIPFEIPKSWAWTRLGMVSTYADFKKKIKPEDIDSNTWVLDLEDIEKGGELRERKVAKEKTIKGDRTSFEEGNILYSKLRPYLLKILVAPSDGLCSSEIVPFSLYDRIIPEYMVAVLKCPYADAIINSVTYGVKMPRVSTETMTSLLVPIPPINEQRKIVHSLNEVACNISQYDTIYQQAAELATRFPQQLRKTILQHAVQGKLVPQDKSDEPASVLLERIRAEKEELIKQGKLKKDKHESVIFRRDNSYYERLDGVERCIDDEIPFEIPKTWSWARLGDISTYADLKKKIKAQDADPNIWGLDLEDIEKGGRILEIKTVGERRAIGDKTFFVAGNILYSKLRPYLMKTLVAPADGICSSEIVPFGLYGGILPEYVVTVLKSPYVHEQINAAMYGVKMPRVSTETMISLLIPIPPVNEQQYIVNKLEQTLLLSKSL